MASTRRSVPLFLAFLGAAPLITGCRLGWGSIDPALAWQARVAVQEGQNPFDPLVRDDEDFHDPEASRPREGSTGEMILGTLLAVFPGLLVHGLGHLYAGDYRTSSQLRRVGGMGYLLGGIGGGLIVGGIFVDEEDGSSGAATSLYVSGGTIGFFGACFFLTAWIYDIIDTPRAVRSGGKPPPRSDFVDSLDLFGG